VAAGRLRRHGPAGAGPLVVLANQGRNVRHRTEVSHRAPPAEPSRPHPCGHRGTVVAFQRPGLAAGQAWWQSERRLRAGRPRNAFGHVPDAEIHWPSIEGSPYAGQVWAIEVELTPKPVTRTTGIMTEMLSGTGYSSVVYLTSPAAHRVVTSAAARLGAADQARLAVRGLPEYAFVPEPTR